MRTLLALAALTAALATPAGAAASAPTLTVRGSSYGKVLFDGRGFVLYAFTHDSRGHSRCSGECARRWPPFVVKVTPIAGKGTAAKLLGTTTRADGSRQLTYAGRPLYYYVGDTAPGVILCQNATEFGGVWLVVAATGRLVT